MPLFLAALFLTTAAIAADAPTPLPLDLAFAGRETWRPLRPVISPDGHHLAYEINTPPARTNNGAGETEARYLPSGFPPFFAGLNLWISDVDTGEARPVCKTGPCWRGSWSPSSRQLAFYSNEEGAPEIWIYDLTSRTARRLMKNVVKVRIGSDQPVWSPDGRTLFVLLPHAAEKGAAASAPGPATSAHATVSVSRTRDRSPGALPAAAEEDINSAMAKEAATLAAIDVATGASRIVVPYDAEPRPYVLRLSPDGRWLSYVSVPRAKSAGSDDLYEDLVIVPSGGGKPAAIFRDIRLPDDGSLDHTYRWTSDSRRIVYSKEGDLWIADIAAGGQPRRLAAGVGKIAGSSLYLTRDGNAALVTIEAEGDQPYDGATPTKALVLVPLDGSEPRVLDVHATPIPADANTVWQPSAGTIAVLGNATPEREVLEVNLVTGKSVRLWSGAARITPVGVPGNAPNAFIARFESLDTPGDFYLFDRNLAIVRRLSHAEPRLDAVQIGPSEGFETVIGGPDGKLLTVRSRVYLPRGGKRGQGFPTIVYFYSGAQATSHAADFGGGSPNTIPVQIFASRGYAVLLCDVPLGPMGKGGNPVQEMTDAILAQVRHSADLGYTNIRRVAIMGQSYGAYSTAAIITRTSLFRAAMALDGVYDLPGNYGATAFDASWSEGGQGRMGTHPWADLERYIANSPYYQADKIHTPLLLIHGEKDSACPVLEAKKMYNALKRLDRDAELAIYAGEGHVTGRWSLANAVDASQRMLDFLEQHLQ